MSLTIESVTDCCEASALFSESITSGDIDLVRLSSARMPAIAAMVLQVWQT
jgi:hypothetical protein